MTKPIEYVDACVENQDKGLFVKIERITPMIKAGRGLQDKYKNC